MRELFIADGIWNSVRRPNEIVTRVQIPIPAPGSRASYAKLRQRKSIDFPLLTVALSADMDEAGVIRRIMGVVTALGARPRELSGWDGIAIGQVLSGDVMDALAERAYQQCRPLENMIVDAEWRRAMVPVHVRKALERLNVTDSWP